jgi:hypothetical protein
MHGDAEVQGDEKTRRTSFLAPKASFTVCPADLAAFFSASPRLSTAESELLAAGFVCDGTAGSADTSTDATTEASAYLSLPFRRQDEA